MSKMLINKPLGEKESREGNRQEGPATQSGGARGSAIKLGVQRRQYELCASVGGMMLIWSTYGDRP